MKTKTKLFVLSLAVCGMLDSSNRLLGDDLGVDQKASLFKLVEKVKQHSQLEKVSPDKVRVVAFDKWQLGYCLVYMAENGIVGPNTEALFEEIKAKVGECELPQYIVAFADEREEMLKVLMKDAEKSINVSASGTQVTYLGRLRTLTQLVSAAQIRLEKKTGYKFKNVDSSGYQ
jgi:hypothetical protein